MLCSDWQNSAVSKRRVDIILELVNTLLAINKTIVVLLGSRKTKVIAHSNHSVQVQQLERMAAITSRDSNVRNDIACIYVLIVEEDWDK